MKRTSVSLGRLRELLPLDYFLFNLAVTSRKCHIHSTITPCFVRFWLARPVSREFSITNKQFTFFQEGNREGDDWELPKFSRKIDDGSGKKETPPASESRFYRVLSIFCFEIPVNFGSLLRSITLKKSSNRATFIYRVSHLKKQKKLRWDYLMEHFFSK